MSKIKTILVFNPNLVVKKSPYNRLKKEHNLKIDFRPFIHVEGLKNRDVRRQKIDFNVFNSIIFTSRNSVDHFFRLSEEMRFKVPDSTKYFCQSEAVAYYLQKYVVYRKRKIYVGEKNLMDLEPMFNKFKGDKFLLPSSDILNQDTIDFLNNININWKRAQLFKTVTSDLSDLRDVYYDILVFLVHLA